MSRELLSLSAVPMMLYQRLRLTADGNWLVTFETRLHQAAIVMVPLSYRFGR